MAISAAMQGLGSVLGLVVGGALTVISWRLAFLINFPIGVIIIWIALTRLEETRHERLKLDITGALLATLGCTAAVFRSPRVRAWLGGPVGDRRGIAAIALVWRSCSSNAAPTTRWCRCGCSAIAIGWRRSSRYSWPAACC